MNADEGNPTPVGRPGAVRVATLFAVTAVVVLVAALVAGVWVANRTGEVARTQARQDALKVARRTAAVINAVIERGATALDGGIRSSGVDRVAGPDASPACSALFSALTVQGFSFELQDPDGTPVCLAATSLTGGRGADAAGRVRDWLRSREGWDRLGPLYEDLVEGRVTLAPDGLPGVLAAAFPTPSGRTATVWIDSARYLAGPMGVALASPGVATAVVVDGDGRVLVPAPRLRAGQPEDSQARPGPDGLPVADPLGRNPVHEQVADLSPGVDASIRPSSRPRGGPAVSDAAGEWVTAPVPRLDAHVAVAYDPSGAAELRAAARRNGLVAALGVGVVALLALMALWFLISRPLVRLASSVRTAERTGRRFTPPSGAAPSEVRSLTDAFVDFTRARDQIGEVAAAARERERARLVDRLNGEVAQSLAAASLVVRTDPAAAAGHLRVASSWLDRVTAELEPLPVPAGGVGAALTVTAGERWGIQVEDRSAGRRLDPATERLLYRSVLEVLDAVAPGADVGAALDRVAVSVVADGPGIAVVVGVDGGGPCPPIDDPGYHERHEFTASGGTVERSSADGRRQLVLRAV